MQVMIDLETLSTAPNAAIIALGAVEFDLDKLTIGREFYQAIDVNDAVNTGGHMSVDTVRWWMQQSKEAQKDAFSGVAKTYNVLLDFGLWLRQSEINGVWGNGADFDNVILRSAYERVGLPTPWSYRQNRCFRTIKAMYPELDLPFNGTAHNALDDARWQATYLLRLTA